jgi:hypothetical protein
MNEDKYGIKIRDYKELRKEREDLSPVEKIKIRNNGGRLFFGKPPEDYTSNSGGWIST